MLTFGGLGPVAGRQTLSTSMPSVSFPELALNPELRSSCGSLLIKLSTAIRSDQVLHSPSVSGTVPRVGRVAIPCLPSYAFFLACPIVKSRCRLLEYSLNMDPVLLFFP